MKRICLRILIAMISMSAAAQVHAEDLTGSTSCADYVRMQAEDTAPGADPSVARAHVVSLMHEYAPYILRDQNGQVMPTIIDFIIAYSTHFCEAHPDATVADAGNAVGAAEQKAIAQAKQQTAAPQ